MIKHHLTRTVLFMVAVALLLLPFGYYATFSKLPSGLHFIRQADGLSFALNYAFHDTPFFTPENFNLFVEDGKAASEFPLIYKLDSCPPCAPFLWGNCIFRLFTFKEKRFILGHLGQPFDYSAFYCRIVLQ
jgi:hypothetical protein